MIRIVRYTMVLAALAVVGGTNAEAQQKKPNILVIWGDDVGMWNTSAYHRGMMSGETPNIDRIVREIYVAFRSAKVALFHPFAERKARRKTN